MLLFKTVKVTVTVTESHESWKYWSSKDQKNGRP